MCVCVYVLFASPAFISHFTLAHLLDLPARSHAQWWNNIAIFNDSRDEFTIRYLIPLIFDGFLVFIVILSH